MVTLGASPCVAPGQMKIGFKNRSKFNFKNGSEFLERIINECSKDYTGFDK